MTPETILLFGWVWVQRIEGIMNPTPRPPVYFHDQAACEVYSTTIMPGRGVCISTGTPPQRKAGSQ